MQHFSHQGPQKITQIWIFGTKINHLATLNTYVSAQFMPSGGR
jgi:hypothetical protein